jgi:hypothetical protein
MAEWDVDDLVNLKGDLRALDDGAEAPEVLFPPLAGGDTNGATGNDAVKEKLRQKVGALGHEVDASTGPSDAIEPDAAPEPQTAEAPPPNTVAGIPGERIAQKARDLKSLSREDLEGLAGELVGKLRKLGVIKSDAQEHGLYQQLVQAGIIRDVNLGADENSTYEVRRAVALLYLIHESKAPANTKKTAAEPAGF